MIPTVKSVKWMDIKRYQDLGVETFSFYVLVYNFYETQLWSWVNCLCQQSLLVMEVPFATMSLRAVDEVWFYIGPTCDFKESTSLKNV